MEAGDTGSRETSEKDGYGSFKRDGGFMQDRKDTRDKREARNRRDKKTCLTAFAIFVMFSRLVPVVLLGGWGGSTFCLQQCTLCTMYTPCGLHSVLLVGHCSQLVKTASGNFIIRMGHSGLALDIMLMVGFLLHFI